MKLILCPNCCESNLVQEGGVFRCALCGALVSRQEKADIEDRIDAALVRGQESDLGKIRYILKSELSADYPDQASVLARCDDILRILPEDPIASLLKAFLRRNTHRKEYHALLSGAPKLTEHQKKALYPYIIDACEHIDAPAVRPFLVNQGDSALLERVDAALKQREEEQDLFANVPRDAFICHAHADMERIKPLLDRLEEEDGFSLWYSERNLPKDADNYKANIENAIENCSVFLVFASSLAMASKDVQWELDVADRLGKRKRLEYRLEDRNNNIRFKYFFDGIQWIDGAKGDDYALLAEKIFLALRERGEIPEATPKPKAVPKEMLPKAEEIPAGNEKKARISADGKTVTLGLYPQTVVSDQTIIAELDKISEPSKNGWYLYNGEYYAKATALPWKHVKKYSDGSRIHNKKTFWFKCEPIKWKVLQKGDDEALIMSERVLDTHCFSGSSNNYAKSEIRAWLNHEFIDLALSDETDIIVTSHVDNSDASTGLSGNQYACEDTEDKVFLLSYAEATNYDYGLATQSSRIAANTDYALAKGAHQKNDVGHWCLRSPYSFLSRDLRGVNYDGNISWWSDIVKEMSLGVRPAIRIKL